MSKNITSYLYEEVQAGHGGVEAVRQQQGVVLNELVELRHVGHSLPPAIHLPCYARQDKTGKKATQIVSIHTQQKYPNKRQHVEKTDQHSTVSLPPLGLSPTLTFTLTLV